VQKPRVHPQALTIEDGKDPQPDQESVEAPAHEAEGFGHDPDRSERRAQEKIGLILMENTQDLAGRKLHIR
jgi:hypothetical protein